MTDKEKFAAAERILASLPKRAKELTREELVDIVDRIQVYMYSSTSVGGQKIKEDGVEVWDAEANIQGSDLVETVDWILIQHGLRPDPEFTGQKVVHP